MNIFPAMAPPHHPHHTAHTLPLNIIANQDLSMHGQHPGHHVPPQGHHHLYQPQTPTQQSVVYGLQQSVPQPTAQSAPSQPTTSTANNNNNNVTSGGSMSESTEQQLIRHHKLALSMLKNGALQSAFSNMAGEEVSAGEEESRTGVGNIDSAWVPKASLVERICGNQGDSLQEQCMMRCLSDFKPCMKEKEIDGRFHIRLRQHREMSLNVETDYTYAEEDEEKRYRIVDEHMKEVVEKITRLVRTTCQHEGRQVMRLVNRNSVAFYAEPGFAKSESDKIIAELKETTECECDKCSRLSFVVKFRCIIDDNRLAKLLEQTPNAPMSYNMMPPSNHAHPQRPGLEMGMANMSLSGQPHEVPGMSSHLMQSGPYSPLVQMGQDGGLVGHHPSAPQQQPQQQHPQHQQQHQQQPYYQAGSHSGQAGLAHQANLAVSASQIFTGSPLLTFTTQLAGQQQTQQTPTHGLQTPEFLFSTTYNVANITPGYPNVASPSSSGAHGPSHLHHPSHHFPAASRHQQTGANPNGVPPAQRQLSGPSQGAKALLPNSGQPQKEKNLPPRLQSQNRMAQAATYGDFFLPGQPGGGYFQSGGGRGGQSGRRGANSFRGSRGRANNYHGASAYAMHHPHAAITGPGGPILHPTPPDLQADFPHLPRVSPAAQEAVLADAAATLPTAPASQPASPALSTYAAVVVHGDSNAN